MIISGVTRREEARCGSNHRPPSLKKLPYKRSKGILRNPEVNRITFCVKDIKKTGYRLFVYTVKIRGA